jgi:hypothetical protein
MSTDRNRIASWLSGVAGAGGAGIAMLVCCPTTKAVAGGILRSPWLITAGLVVAALAIATIALRRTGHAGIGEDCYPPTVTGHRSDRGEEIRQAMGVRARAVPVTAALTTALALAGCAAATSSSGTHTSAAATAPRTESTNDATIMMRAAPYAYLGWGNLPNPTTIMSATGVKWFTMAFMLTNGTCNPAWDGDRPLTGGHDQSTINAIRAAGGNVIVSFGGASGTKLERSCTSANALTGAYQKVISAYGLKGIDIDIEKSEYQDATIQQRTIDALKQVKADNPGLVVYVTFPSDQSGPDASMINRAAASGLTVDGWTIMPFDFGGSTSNMGTLTLQATDGLKNRLKTAYGYSDDTAYRHSGISSMNGITDTGEHVSQTDFQLMLSYAQQHHLARFTFWSANRDRPCPGAYPNDDTCSGTSQAPWDFTKIIAQYQG